MADSLVEANLRGIDTHGVARVSHYLSRIESGSIRAKPRIRIVKSRGATALLDGGHGFGQIVNERAAGHAVRRARKTGAGWVAIRNSSHCGSLSYFGLRIARENMVAILFTDVEAIALPYHATKPFQGTNPICIAAPSTHGEFFCLDMATTLKPWNFVMNARSEGEKLPRGVAVNGMGNDTTDPMLARALYAFGGHRGSGLALSIDLLCSLLSGSPYGPHISHMYGDLAERRHLGGLLGALDISAFTTVGSFKRRLRDFMEEIRSLPPRPGVKAVLVPGDPEKQRTTDRKKAGIPLPDTVVEDLNQLGIKAGLDNLSAL